MSGMGSQPISLPDILNFKKPENYMKFHIDFLHVVR